MTSQISCCNNACYFVINKCAVHFKSGYGLLIVNKAYEGLDTLFRIVWSFIAHEIDNTSSNAFSQLPVFIFSIINFISRRY